jgi:hypothetical protein
VGHQEDRLVLGVRADHGRGLGLGGRVDALERFVQGQGVAVRDQAGNCSGITAVLLMKVRRPKPQVMLPHLFQIWKPNQPTSGRGR